MSANEPIVTPVGRLVAGSLYKPSTRDMAGKPLVDSEGQPKVDYWFILAIEKGAEKHWAETAWGQKIWAVGHTNFPNQASLPTFSWKVKDGDSQIVDVKGKRPCDREGHAGCWILNFSSQFAPQIVMSGGKQVVTEKDFVKLGDYVQIAGSISGNQSTIHPGIKLWHSHVCFNSYGERIVSGIDPEDIGFETEAHHKGSKVPLSNFVPPATGNLYTPPVPAGSGPIVPSTPMPPVTPHVNILTPQPPIPQRVMLQAANGVTYEQLIAAGWNDTQLVQHGLMAP